jgi:hypothetical protein
VGEYRSDDFMHAMASRSLKELPLANSLMNYSEAGINDEAHITIADQIRGRVLHDSDENLQDLHEDRFFGCKIGDFESAAGDSIHNVMDSFGDMGSVGIEDL